MLEFIPFTVIVPQQDGSVKTTKMDINPTQVGAIQTVMIPTGLTGTGNQPISKPASGMLVHGSMFVVDMKAADLKRILLNEKDDEEETPKDSL